MSHTVRGVCPHDCPDTCGVLTLVEDAKAIGFSGDPEHPATSGWLCAKVRPYLDHVYHPDRVLYPLRRTGPKGSGSWERVSWDSALDEIVSRWQAIMRKHGPEAILPYSYSGTLGLVQGTVSSARLWNRLGVSRLERSICGAAAELAVESTLGARWSPPVAELEHSQIVILWGHNPVSTAPHFMPFLRRARNRGCQVVVIDPVRSRSAQSADLHLMPLPGTDGWVAMAMAHVIVQEGLHDEAWLEKHALGWPELRGRLGEFSPARAARESGIAEQEIVHLARLYATSKPGLIKMADGVNRNLNGGQNVRAICMLPALTGQYGQRGGGLAYSTSGYTVWDRSAVHHDAECPVPTRTVNMNRIGAALLGDEGGTPIKALYVFNANPVTSTPNSGRTIEGLLRNDLFTVVHDLFLTDTAQYADIVLPATSQLEQIDLHRAYGQTTLAYNHPAIPPCGEAKSNWEVMTLLARGLGLDEPWLRQSVDEVIDEILTATARTNPRLRGITLAALKRDGARQLALPESPPFADCNFPTPSGKVELFSKVLAEKGADPLPGAFSSLTKHADELWLVSPASHHFVSSSLASQTGLRQAEGEPVVALHPSDAGPRGLTTGVRIRIENARGWFEAECQVTDNVRPGVALTPKGYWHKFHGGRGVNCTTSDDLADLAGQSTFHTNAVRIRKAKLD